MVIGQERKKLESFLTFLNLEFYDLYSYNKNKMAQTKTYNSHKAHKAAQRTAFMEAGGYDGRFRPRTVKSKKAYSRKGRNSKGYLGGQD